MEQERHIPTGRSRSMTTLKVLGLAFKSTTAIAATCAVLFVLLFVSGNPWVGLLIIPSSLVLAVVLLVAIALRPSQTKVICLIAPTATLVAILAFPSRAYLMASMAEYQLRKSTFQEEIDRNENGMSRSWSAWNTNALSAREFVYYPEGPGALAEPPASIEECRQYARHVRDRIYIVNWVGCSGPLF